MNKTLHRPQKFLPMSKYFFSLVQHNKQPTIKRRPNSHATPRDDEESSAEPSRAENSLTVFGGANSRQKMSCDVFDDEDQSVTSLGHEKCQHHHFHHHHHHYHFHSLSGSSSAGNSPFPSLGTKNLFLIFSK